MRCEARGGSSHMAHDARSFVIRQAGLGDLCARARGCDDAFRLALVDGAVDTTHPAFQSCRISTIGDSQSARAGEHATFSASILVGSDADRRFGRVMAMCAGGTLFNYAVVTDEMLAGEMSTRDAAKTLAAAVRLAVQADCQTIAFGIELRHPESLDWRPLRQSLLAAVEAGSIVILPAGNRDGTRDASSLCRWPEALVVGSCDWRGDSSAFSPLFGRSGNTICAPGENIPGAGPASGYTVRSGTSFAAAVAAGAFGLAKHLSGRPVFDIVAALCRPPHHILDGTDFFTKQPAHF